MRDQPTNKRLTITRKRLTGSSVVEGAPTNHYDINYVLTDCAAPPGGEKNIIKHHHHQCCNHQKHKQRCSISIVNVASEDKPEPYNTDKDPQHDEDAGHDETVDCPGEHTVAETTVTTRKTEKCPMGHVVSQKPRPVPELSATAPGRSGWFNKHWPESWQRL